MNEIIKQAISRLTEELEQVKGNRYVECVKNQTVETATCGTVRIVSAVSMLKTA